MNRREFTRTAVGAVGAMSLGRNPFGDRRAAGHLVSPDLRVDGERISVNLTKLSQFGKNPSGGVSRVAYTQFDKDGRELALQLAR